MAGYYIISEWQKLADDSILISNCSHFPIVLFISLSSFDAVFNGGSPWQHRPGYRLALPGVLQESGLHAADQRRGGKLLQRAALLIFEQLTEESGSTGWVSEHFSDARFTVTSRIWDSFLGIHGNSVKLKLLNSGHFLSTSGYFAQR